MDYNKMKATRESYGEALIELGKMNKNVVVLDADLSPATKTNGFAKSFPDRFFNMGIAEQDMIGTACGFATCGKIPYASTFAVFATGRAYDQVRNSVCYPNLNVKICATHSGITVGEDGATHQMLEDIGLMRGLPNMNVFCPSDDTQTKWIIQEISKIDGPCYVRLGRAAVPQLYDVDEKFEIGGAYQFGEGTDATIFTCGLMVSEALGTKKILEEKGINVRVIDMYSIKPINEEIIIKSAKETKKLFSVEEHNIIGGLGTAISEVLTSNYPAYLKRLGVNDRFGKSGKWKDLLKYFKLEKDSLASMIEKEIK